MISDLADWNIVSRLSNKGKQQNVINQLRAAKEKIKTAEFEQELKAYFGSRQREETRIAVMLEKVDWLLTTIR